jgi:hypothetical protein
MRCPAEKKTTDIQQTSLMRGNAAKAVADLFKE